MRVLVVEDEMRLAETLQWGLEADGYAVDLAHDGEEGLELARLYPYQVIVLDIMLPKLNGYRVCAALRELGISTPILMLTAKNGEYDEAEALDTGADDFLSKPFSYVVLGARLRALTRRGGAGSSATLAFGDLVLDPAKRTCQRAGRPVTLTTKEFAVLECLLRHDGQVAAKNEILEQVWDMAFQGDPNIVEVYVSALRRKLDAPFGRHTITTVRGVGYRLVADE
ncbi:DNA-binding response regulator, OmpR family, contains REC and winged-helix (wHTH) domain [Amycolatopsis xylanica]|uniref:DNA-binding response regulator, OmpR family, contains REC and winged-helix (WHTH) domain n=1 Tax=Amycolatopsis xylanica TaxID=589385 RepID=A0A1H3K9L6_9PSEU|nr:response regulator transcription factor [Amycolatopsis xylanica]SDY48891.1 DNA-binding response regulator, OmpR family, contains REC and winged-helix (wHTH) domain [Amycolatopsis xylanica]